MYIISRLDDDGITGIILYSLMVYLFNNFYLNLNLKITEQGLKVFENVITNLNMVLQYTFHANLKFRCYNFSIYNNFLTFFDSFPI